MAWISFVISFVGMAAGLIYLEVEPAVKGFFAMAYLFSVASCFTLSKVIRDKHEYELDLARSEMAKTERFIKENE